jgi:hypothetical protein
MRGLVLKGQRRVHMKKESEPRKRMIATAIVDAGIIATVYDAGRSYRHELDARLACLRALIADLSPGADTLLVLEQDDSLLRWDKQHLIEITRSTECHDTFRYEHHRASAEQLLGIPDVVAWCWAQNGEWRRRIRRVVTDVQTV